MTTISKVRAAAYCAARCRLRSTLNPERPVIWLGIFLRVGIVISDRQMRAGMRSGGQKNGTVTSMPRGFERICLVLGASYTWTFIVVPARIYAGAEPVRPFAARLPEQCFPECGAFPGPMGQAGAGWLLSDARPVCSSDWFHRTSDRRRRLPALTRWRIACGQRACPVHNPAPSRMTKNQARAGSAASLDTDRTA